MRTYLVSGDVLFCDIAGVVERFQRAKQVIEAQAAHALAQWRREVLSYLALEAGADTEIYVELADPAIVGFGDDTVSSGEFPELFAVLQLFPTLSNEITDSCIVYRLAEMLFDVDAGTIGKAL